MKSGHPTEGHGLYAQNRDIVLGSTVKTIGRGYVIFKEEAFFSL